LPFVSTTVVSGRRRAALALAALVLFLLATYAEVMLGERSLLTGFDNSVQSVAWYAHLADAVAARQLPLWDDLQFGGHTFIGEAQTGVFYPLNLALAFVAGSDLSLPGIQALLVLHVLLAGVLQFALLRVLGAGNAGALAAAMAFAGGGFLFSRLGGQTNIFISAVWLPLAFLLFHLALHRSRWFAAAAGGVVALSLVGGHINPPFLIGLALGFYALAFVIEHRSLRAVRVAAVSLLALAVVAGLASAVQLLPSLEYEDLAVRFVGPGDPIASGDEIPYSVVGFLYVFDPADLPQFLSPLLGETLEGTAYVGVVTLVLAVVGLATTRRAFALTWGGLALASLVFMMGHHLLVHQALYEVVPFMDKLRQPMRAAYVLHFALTVLAGFGMHALVTRAAASPAGARRWAGRAAIAVAGLTVLGMLFAQRDGVVAATDAEGVRVGLLLIVGAGALAAVRLAGAVPVAVAVTGLLVLLALDLGFNNRPGQPPEAFDRVANLEPDRFYRPGPAIRFLQAQPGIFRVDDPDRSMPPNVGHVHRLQMMGGHGATMTQVKYDLIGRGYFPPSRTHDLMNVQYAVRIAPVPGWEPVERDPNAGTVWRHPDPMPRVWLARSWEVQPDDEAARDRAYAPDFPHRERVVLDRRPRARPGGTGSASISRYASDRIEVRTRAPRGGVLVLAELQYPGWRAEVDGREADVMTADGFLRAVELPPGARTVELTYRPTNWTLAVVMTVLGVLAALAGAVLGVLALRRRRTGPGLPSAP
jgi:hypothetical protein